MRFLADSTDERCRRGSRLHGLLAVALAVAALGGGPASAVGQDGLPSCRTHTWFGNAGYIAVQTSAAGSIAWGIYLWDKTAEAGPWWVDVHVGGRRVDHKPPSTQTYAPQRLGQSRSTHALDRRSASRLAMPIHVAVRTLASVMNGCIIAPRISRPRDG